MTKKLPSPTTYGPYEINIIGDYTRLEKLIDSREIILKGITKENYLDSFKAHLEAFCNENKLDFESYFGSKFPIIVDSKTYAFEQHLGHCLVSFDINKISSLLDYQFAAYKGDKLFPTIVEHAAYDCVKRLSKFGNAGRLREIMRWVNAHRKFIPNSDLNKASHARILKWINGDEIKLKTLSRKIWKSKATDNQLDFYRAIIDGIKTKWNVAPETLAHLIHILVEKRLLKSKSTKGHFKAAQLIFDFGQKSNDKIRLSELSSRINKDILKDPTKRRTERDFVSKVTYGQ